MATARINAITRDIIRFIVFISIIPFFEFIFIVLFRLERVGQLRAALVHAGWAGRGRAVRVAPEREDRAEFRTAVQSFLVPLRGSVNREAQWCVAPGIRYRVGRLFGEWGFPCRVEPACGGWVSCQSILRYASGRSLSLLRRFSYTNRTRAAAISSRPVCV